MSDNATVYQDYVSFPSAMASKHVAITGNFLVIDIH